VGRDDHQNAPRSQVAVLRGVRLRPRWASGQPTTREVAALRAVIEPLGNVPLAVLMERALAGERFESEGYLRRQADRLQEDAARRGLDLVQLDVSECIEFDAATWIPDGGTETPFGSGAGVFAVGWLSAFHPFRAGEPDPALADMLDRMLCDPRRWLPWACAGMQVCEFCAEASGAQGLLVPAGDVLFVAPDLIGHYVRRHGYVPPDELSAAVWRCPEAGSRAYYECLLRFQALWPTSAVPIAGEGSE